jgi:hypothetical protein
VTAGIWGESSPDGGAAVAAKPWQSHAAIRLKRLCKILSLVKLDLIRELARRFFCEWAETSAGGDADQNHE